MLQAGFSGRLLLFFYRINDGCISFPSHLFAPSWLAGLSHVPMVLPELLGGQFLAEQLIATEMESLGAMGVTVWLFYHAVIA